jgi:hypothetical protein
MHMLHRRRWLAARFLAVGLLAATLSAVDSLASPTPAEAHCAGNGNPVRSTFSYNGKVRVSETPVTGTCNGNNIYTGVLKDESRDANCVSIYFWEASTGWRKPPGGQVCGKGNTSRFEWRDHNGNSRAYEQFCIFPDDGTPNTVCGWGTLVGNSGVNYGY